MKSITHKLTLILSLVLIAGSGGCISASLATIGTVLGALGSAASTGADVYKLGKLDAALNCDASTCCHAAVRAAGDLGFRIHPEAPVEKPNVVYKMTLTDDLNHAVEIRIEHASRSMCLCRVDVGFFGSEPTARLVLERIRAHLPKTATTNL